MSYKPVVRNVETSKVQCNAKNKSCNCALEMFCYRDSSS